MNRFLGAWRLVSFEEETSDGEIVYPYGESAVGLLIYESSGRMSVQIMRRDREPFPSNDWREVPAEEIKSAVEGFTAFFGSYEVDADNKTVIHRVEGHVLPGSVGKMLRREFEFAGDFLILKPSPNRRVIWERVTK
ncbi:MAG TPA: lipocalin-like domain-containing protein [Blastocatellia bacterium]|nr:lipocalin-like domain-containing protein [Blastocatellia bacterium]